MDICPFLSAISDVNINVLRRSIVCTAPCNQSPISDAGNCTNVQVMGIKYRKLHSRKQPPVYFGFLMKAGYRMSCPRLPWLYPGGQPSVSIDNFVNHQKHVALLLLKLREIRSWRYFSSSIALSERVAESCKCSK